MKFGIVRFPGSNCDFDCLKAVRDVMKAHAEFIWHEDDDLKGSDCVVLPGGFSYGDYLRTGAIARFSPVMKKVREFAERGGIVMGICNGFQVLTEAKMLSGTLMINKELKFICKEQYVKVENNNSIFTGQSEKNDVINLPIAHGEGRFYAEKSVLEKLNKNGQIILRYSSRDGKITDEYNPNGSMENIAGICNEMGNVFGLMPHPERACERRLGSEDGLVIFRSILTSKQNNKHQEPNTK